MIHLPILINFALNGNETATDLQKNVEIPNYIGNFKHCVCRTCNLTVCKDNLESPNKVITLFSEILLDLQRNFSFVWSSSCYL